MALAFPKPPSRYQAKRDRAAEVGKQQREVVRQVKERDGYRCRACASKRDVDAHHIKFRSAGGGWTLKNLACLCRIHHDDLHGYRMAIIGDDANGTLKFVFRDGHDEKPKKRTTNV